MGRSVYELNVTFSKYGKKFQHKLVFTASSENEIRSKIRTWKNVVALGPRVDTVKYDIIHEWKEKESQCRA